MLNKIRCGGCCFGSNRPVWGERGRGESKGHTIPFEWSVLVLKRLRNFLRQRAFPHKIHSRGGEYGGQVSKRGMLRVTRRWLGLLWAGILWWAGILR